MLEQVVAAIAQALVWSLLSLGLFISFRILSIADMTTEGSFALGAVVTVRLLHAAVHPLVALLIGMAAGSLAGIVTAFLTIRCGIPSLLAGILTMVGLYSINLRVLQRAHLGLLNQVTYRNFFADWSLPRHYDTILLALMILGVVLSGLSYFFRTDLGQALIATGDNAKMATAQGIATEPMMFLALALSNGLAALSGGLLAQTDGYADVNGGSGAIVIGLAALIIGEVLFGKQGLSGRLLCTVFGAVVYRLLLLAVIYLGFANEDFKLLSAALIAVFLAMPTIQAKWQHKRRMKGGRVQ